mmetsp:Transcript_6806/g.16706  ORF Transcript_6806/g.16706 Transcript_6806/m.16706 type:complete len:202 (+) Transcript_6806:142-747(+)
MSNTTFYRPEGISSLSFHPCTIPPFSLQLAIAAFTLYLTPNRRGAHQNPKSFFAFPYHKSSLGGEEKYPPLPSSLILRSVLTEISRCSLPSSGTRLPNSSLRPTVGIRLGHQFLRPAMVRTAGTRIVRTTKVSNRTEENKIHPIWLSVSVWENKRPPNAIAIITPAAVMIPPVSWTALRIDARSVNPSMRYSATRHMRNMS